MAILAGKSERRLAVAFLVTSMVQLAAAIFVAKLLFDHAASSWFDPEVGQALDRSVDLHKDFVAAIKADMRHQTDAISADEVLRQAALSKNTELIEAELDALFPHFPELVALRVEDEAGGVLASRDRGRPVDDTRERKLDVSRSLGPSAESDRSAQKPPQEIDRTGGEGPPAEARSERGPRIVATFAAPRARVDTQETLGAVVRRYHTLEAKRDEVYRGSLLAFACVAGIMAVFTLGLGTWLARGVTTRIARLAEAIDKVGEGDMTVRVPVTGSDELTDLALTFNRMLEDMQASRARIEFLQRIGAWQEMAQRLAHEIKNPLTPIQLAVQECHRKYGGDDPRYRALLDTTLEIVEEEVGTLRRLVGDFSNFARLPHAELREANLQDFLGECREQLVHLETQADGDGAAAAGGEPLAPDVDVVWDVPGEPLPVEIDRQMMRRVLVNLVRNALQAIRDQKKGKAVEKVGGKVVVSARKDDGAVVIRVEDDGPGIPEEQRERVFDPYFTTKNDGTGLGLAIVKKIVVEHGGSVEAGKSETLGGALFMVKLPRPRVGGRSSRELRAIVGDGEGVSPASAR